MQPCRLGKERFTGEIFMLDQTLDQGPEIPMADPSSSSPREKRNLDYFLTRIGEVWYRTTDSILEVGALCAEASRSVIYSPVNSSPIIPSINILGPIIIAVQFIPR